MIEQTARIVTAFMAGNPLAGHDIPDLIRATYAALVATSSPNSAAVADRAPPAVPIKKSVTPDAVICLECGRKFSMLKRHLGTHHSLSAADYRMKWGLPSTYPMVAPNYATLRSALAVKIGLGHSRES